MKTVIIGGVAGGATAATRLRRLDEKMEIVILERGEFVSFANCGLPYYIGVTIQDKDELTLQTPESFKDRYNIDVRVLNNAISINPDDKNVLVEDLRTNTKYLLPYDKLILSPGAKPVKPNIEGIDNRNVLVLRNIPDTIAIKNFIKENKPKNAVIIGGGYIGLEMMENLMSIGIKTSVVELSDHLIGGLDFDMAADVHRYLKQKGVKLYLKNAVRAINDNKAILNNCDINSDLIILSVGVKPETDIAKNCGIKVNQRGNILVNKNMETNIPDIYAVGDAIEVENFITKAPAFIPLAGPANKQGRIVSDNIAGLPSIYNGTQGTSILKIFDMTVATTGLNETSAKSAGINYDKTYIYSASHATYYPNATNMSIKVLWDKKTLKIIGAQIIGFDRVDKRIDVLATAIRFGAVITDLAELELSYAPPFGSAKDPINMLGFVAENIVTGKVKQFFWHDVESLPRDGSVTLLDTRTTAEVASGKIQGFKNIPLNSLRNKLDEIPKDKPVYVHCHSGLRSYIACRILSGNGYDCYNLAGGWRLYESIMNEKTSELKIN